jgi:hypothetical protein
MSVYATIHGELTFPNSDASNHLTECLTKYGYADFQDEKLFFIDELGRVKNHGYDNSVLADNVLTIPVDSYRNMHKRVWRIARRFEAKGAMYYFSSDGRNCAGAYVDGEQKVVVGTEELLDVIRPHIKGEFEIYKDVLEMNHEDYETKYPNDDSYEQSIYEVLELASTTIGNSIKNNVS